MKNSRRSVVTLAMLAAMLSVQSVSGQPAQTQPSSAESSKNSDIHVKHGGEPQRDGPRTLNACSAAADELKASRRLIELLESETALLKDRLATEKQTTSLLLELTATQKAESEALRNAINAKNETIAAKDKVIETQSKLVDALNKKKTSPWKRIGDVLIGVAAGMVFR